MIDSSTRRAIRWLRNREKNRRALAVFSLIWGVVMISLGLWTLQSTGSLLAETIDLHAEEPGYSLPLISHIAAIQTKAEFSLMIGFLGVVFGAIRLFVPDTKSKILLALIDKTQLEEGGDA